MKINATVLIVAAAFAAPAWYANDERTTGDYLAEKLAKLKNSIASADAALSHGGSINDNQQQELIGFGYL